LAGYAFPETTYNTLMNCFKFNFFRIICSNFS